MAKEFPTQYVLELACAAQRIAGKYRKEPEPHYAEDGAYLYTNQTNKMVMLVTADPAIWTADPKEAPMPVKIQAEDIAMAEEVKKHFRKFMFSAIEGENEFQTSINSILTGDNVQTKMFGYVACLPSVYARDVVQTKIKKVARQVDDKYIAEVGISITDLDCEIVSTQRSKNFDAWNIDAIINNMMVSWMSKVDLKVGPCVVVKAKVKDHAIHWKHNNAVTRLNYVKAAQ